MSASVLLLLTILCGFGTLGLFRWVRSVRNAPFSSIKPLWGDLDYMSLSEKTQLRQRFASLTGVGQLPWLGVALTIALGILTVRAFLS